MELKTLRDIFMIVGILGVTPLLNMDGSLENRVALGITSLSAIISLILRIYIYKKKL